MNEELMNWLNEQLAKAEKALEARGQMEKAWRSGSDASWAAAAKLHPSTATGPTMKQVDRLKEAEAQKRIANKCRRDVEMLKAVIAQIEATP